VLALREVINGNDCENRQKRGRFKEQANPFMGKECQIGFQRENFILKKNWELVDF
jgi:hypothetical protein